MKTFRDIKHIEVNVTVATLDQDAGNFKKGDSVRVTGIMSDDELMVEKWGTIEIDYISMDTQIR